MSKVTAIVKVNDRPLKRAFVEHTFPNGMGSLGLTMTDDRGSFSFEAGPLASRVDVKIHCQNSVLKVFDGGSVFRDVSFNGSASNGATINITDNIDHFRILNQCLDVYDTVWRQFKPYSETGRGKFPLKRERKLHDTFKSPRRIELSYPDNFPSDLAFVEPSGLSNGGFPLVHIKDRSRDGRLFGEGDEEASRRDATLLPHEMGHAFHFALLAGAGRIEVETRYLGELMKQALKGDLGHEIDKRTSPFVAYIEAIGAFSERFFLFKRRVKPRLKGLELRRAFLADELSEQSTLSKSEDGPMVQPEAQMQVGHRGPDGTITPVLRGNDREGAVYGAIFLDFGSRIGLRDTVELVLTSGATDFDGFRRHVRGRNVDEWTTAINAVRRSWDM